MKPNTVGRTGGKEAIGSPNSPRSTRTCAGLPADGVILTRQGERRVDAIAVGDSVITRDSGFARVTSIRHRDVRTQVIRIQAGSLGHTRPDRDVTLPAGQLILVRDWRAKALFNTRQALVSSHRLIDGEFIIDTGTFNMTLYEIEFDRAHVLYVDGLEVASWTAEAAQAETRAA